MPNPHPLTLPEVRIIVSQYLDFTSRKACALVSKAWHADFRPSVWERVFIPGLMDRARTKEDKRALLTSVRNNIHCIKQYSYSAYSEYSYQDVFYELHQLFLDQCHSLVSIEVATRYSSYWETFLALIKQNKQDLRYLHLQAEGQVERHWTDRQVHTLLAGHSNLRRLTLNCVSTISGLIQALAACPSLRELLVRNHLGPDRYDCYEEGVGRRLINYDDIKDLPQLATHNLQTLDLNSCADDELGSLLATCPKIDSLSLRIGLLTSHNLLATMASHPLYSLCTLKLRYYDGMPKIKSILAAFPPHQLHDVSLLGVEANDVQQLVECQHKSLMAIDIHSIRWWPYQEVLTLLASCPLLKTITVTTNSVVDIRYLISRPWICSNLEVFEIALGLDRASADLELLSHASVEKEEVAPGRDECEQAEMVFLKQLGQLTKLRDLTFNHCHQDSKEPAQSCLTWRLSRGLGSLAGLSQLERLQLGRGPFLPGIAEVEFMKAHWQNLWQLGCERPNSDEMQGWMQESWPSMKVVVR